MKEEWRVVEKSKGWKVRSRKKVKVEEEKRRE
jgi:hypothetical protein